MANCILGMYKFCILDNLFLITQFNFGQCNCDIGSEKWDHKHSFLSSVHHSLQSF